MTLTEYSASAASSNSIGDGPHQDLARLGVYCLEPIPPMDAAHSGISASKAMAVISSRASLSNRARP